MQLDLKLAYEILQVEFKSSFSTVKKAYRKLALKFHPDKCKNANSQENFDRIKKAYEFLEKEEKKPQRDNNVNQFGNLKLKKLINF